jgi:hypothetical protein
MSRGGFVIKRISVFYLHRPISSSSNTLGSEAESEGHDNFSSKTTVRIAAGHDHATWATRPLHRVINWCRQL